MIQDAASCVAWAECVVAVVKRWFFESGSDAFAFSSTSFSAAAGRPHFYDCTTAAYTYAGEGGADEGDGGGADAPFTGPWPGT